MAKTKSTSNAGGSNGSYTSQAPSADDVIKQQDETMRNALARAVVGALAAGDGDGDTGNDDEDHDLFAAPGMTGEAIDGIEPDAQGIFDHDDGQGDDGIDHVGDDHDYDDDDEGDMDRHYCFRSPSPFEERLS